MIDFLNTVEGEEAGKYKVIRMDSMADAHKGVLVQADAMAGTFSWKDHVNGELKTAALGPHSIKIIKRR